MRVQFRQSGGFAPIFRGCDLDTETLPADEAHRLEHLIEESGILNLESARVPGARDVRLYEIALERGAGAYEIRFDHLSVPAKARPLLEFLQARSRDLPPDM